MPSSDPRILTETCREIIVQNPKTVLDIGIGFGKWGVLAREYTDIWNQRFYPSEWETFIVGVEVHSKYDNPIWDVYNLVLGGEAMQVLHDIQNDVYAGRIKPEDAGSAVIPPKHYDMVIMIDVLEHFEKIRGQLLIDKVMELTDKFLVSYSNLPQKDIRDNKFEDHLSTWEERDFSRFSSKHIVGGAGWGVYLLSKK